MVAAKNALTGNEPNLQETEIERLAVRVISLSTSSKDKQDGLFRRAARRTKWQRGLQIAAGVLALFSGTAMTSVLLSLTSSLVMKIIAAALAFLSGTISLVMTTFDPKETEKMFDGAAHHEKFGNDAMLLYESRGSITPGRFRERVERLIADWNRLSQDYDRFLSNLGRDAQEQIDLTQRR